MNSDTSLTKIEQTLPILKAIAQLPELYLLSTSKNSSQVNHWYGEKVFYTDLNHMLTYFFMGKVAPKKLGLLDQEILETEADKWISFYDLIHCAWEFIEIESIRVGLDLIEIRASSPGEAIQLIIKNQSTHDFLQIKANHLEFSPQKAHRYFKEFIDEYNTSISNDEYQEIVTNSRYRQTGEEQFPELKSFYRFYLLIAFKYKNRSKRLNNKYQYYMQQLINSFELAKKLSHPSRRQKGFTICNGEKHRHP